MKIVTVIGARPQFIKASAVSRKFLCEKNVDEIIIHTGQHFDTNMSDIFFEELGIPKPAYHLGIHSKTHGAMTGQMLEKIEEVLLKEKPDVVLVYGDTNSTLAGALAAKKLHINVAHVEAGLRSFNMLMPEEINRILTDRISDQLFVPTAVGRDNLLREGVSEDAIYFVGDVMYDTALYFAERADGCKINSELDLKNKKYILSTIHRAENTDNREKLFNIFSALNKAAEEYEVILPLHPRTRKYLELYGLTEMLGGIKVIEPVGYLDMVALEKNAQLILTDSGGVQKEAFFYQVPCVTVRNETEWCELVESGWNTVSPPLNNTIFEDIGRAVNGKPAEIFSFYGTGRAADEIVNILNNIRI